MEPKTYANPTYNMMRNESVEVNRVTQFVVVNLTFGVCFLDLLIM